MQVLLNCCDLTWILDDNGKAAPDKHTSLLYAEYNQTLSPQGFPLTLFQFCLANGRVAFAKRPDQGVREAITRLIPRNKKDRVVLGAACGSADRVLVSNDNDDFSQTARREAYDLLQVVILDTAEASAS
jgi:hypothetical protein